MTTQEPEEKSLVNFSQAAKMAGISRPTIYRRIKDGRLHPVHIGESRFLFRAEVEELKEKK